MVTSHFEDLSIRSEAESMGVKIIPKGIAAFVPITWDQGETQCIDAILIDNDPMMHLTWGRAAERSQKRIRAFYSVEAFQRVAEEFNMATPLYVDSDLGQGIRGEVEAERICRAGFENIFISTGLNDFTLRRLRSVLSISPIHGWMEGPYGTHLKRSRARHLIAHRF